MNEQFISEAIRPVASTFDTARMAAGEPGLPREFIWRREHIRLAAVRRAWCETGPCHHGSGEQYVRKHWYEVEDDAGRMLKLYFERQPRGKPGSARWRLFSMAEANPAGAAARALQPAAPPHSFCLRTTPFGPVAVLWSPDSGEPKVRRILLSMPGTPATHVLKRLFPDSRAAGCAQIDALVGCIESFLAGEDIRFSLDAVRLDLCSAFQQKVLRAEHAISRGSVSTYRLIARRVGNPQGARAVGMALATNPFPLVIPCHRAIRSDGAMGGFQGGLKMKRALLEMEGIVFRGADRVAARGFYYEVRGNP